MQSGLGGAHSELPKRVRSVSSSYGMVPALPMEKTERLLDLIALLLDAQAPMTWAQIRAAFPEDYGGAPESADRKFERDKAELLELGIPLTFRPVSSDGESEGGYAVDRASYYLPEPQLSPDELAVLYAAGSAALASGAFPAKSDLAHALRKVGFFAGGPLPRPHVRLELGGVAETHELPERLEALWTCIGARKSIDVTYFSPRSGETTQRRVDPYGLALRRGLWSLVGYCHLRGGVRTFHVHRIRVLEPNVSRPRTADFEVPADFALEQHVAAWPWQHRFHAPVEVELALTGELSPLAASLFPGAHDLSKPGLAKVIVAATDLEGLLHYVLSLGSEAKVLGPARARAAVREIASRIVALHAAATATAEAP
jgi:proteasome accessory factor B